MDCASGCKKNRGINSIVHWFEIAVICVWLIIVNILFFWSRITQSSFINTLLD